MKTTPLLRFNLAMIVAVLLLAFSISHLYRWASADSQPTVDARLVLNTVQYLQQQQRPLRCLITQDELCEHALFIEYPIDFWHGSEAIVAGEVVAMQDTQRQVMLCSAEPAGELLCINQLDWPDNRETQLDLAYVFYFLLFTVLFLLSRSLFRDIEILRSSALAEINVGKFPSFALSKRSYLAPLAQSLRNMTARIEQLNRFQAEMAETVCHDIKTPLARLKFVGHLLQPGNIDDVRRQIENNVNDIENNVYDYLRLAQNEYSEQHFDLQPTALAPLLRTSAEVFAQDPTIEISVCVEGEGMVTADPMLLARAINNLLGNAVRFARQRVVLNLVHKARFAVIVVEDDGPGWSGTPTRDTGTSANSLIQHHGIGLAIVRQVVERHDGHLQFAISDLGGAKVSMYLPLSLGTEI